MVQKKVGGVVGERKARGRPRAYDPEIALQCATDAFWKTGYSGTSLDDITAATGMNRPSLQAAFGDKRTIYLMSLGAYWTRKFETMRQTLEGDRPLREALMDNYEAALSVYFSGDGAPRGCFVVGTAITEAVEDPAIQLIVAEGFRTLDRKFENRFIAARDSGELGKDADPEALAMLATATMQSISIRARTGSSREELRRFASKVVALICG